jgi:CRP-like cAMP-binding protein
MKGLEYRYGPHEIICRQGEPSSDIYLLTQGKLLACALQGTKVIPLGTISPGQFFGELSFFDGRPRASHVVTLKDSVLVKITQADLQALLPKWFRQVGESLTKKIRLLDQVVHEVNLRRFTEDLRPLSIEEQRTLYAAITQQDT